MCSYSNGQPTEVKERKRVLKPRGPKPDVQPTPTRRQERNRLAQQALRDRRAQYLLFLEQSFINLQEDNTKLVKANEELQTKLVAAQSANSQLPPASQPYTRQHPESASISPLTDISNQALAQPEWDNTIAFMASPPASDYDDPTAGIRYVSPPSTRANPQAPIDLTYAMEDTHTAASLDYHSIAASMILALEHLCIDHVQPHAMRKFHFNGSAHGHAMMLITPSATQIQNFPENEYYTPDNAELERTLNRLLSLSERLDLSGDKITPVMAWKKLELHPKFRELRQTDFATLKEMLEKDVRCHGFGAVFEVRQFDNALSSVLRKKMS
ncbi:MAG: hypothetical protein M1814_006843 [Vezdaea aestivalis]|nr:MAG: hypothetical protein M1814_006843 [Vezdaea aestivalis]